MRLISEISLRYYAHLAGGAPNTLLGTPTARRVLEGVLGCAGVCWDLAGTTIHSYQLLYPIDLVLPTNPCTAAHNQVNAVTEGPHTSCRVRGGTVQPSHAGRTARPAPPPAVPLRGHVEPLAPTAPMHSARSKEGAAACTAAVPR
eukprot:COSAG01_NODE_1210_length_11227_cov_46.803019_5_plen_145_part_00